MLSGIVIIFFLICGGAFFSMSEISLAGSRRIKLQVLSDEGRAEASRIMFFQEQPGMYFTTVQIGLNGMAILGGIIGDTFFSPGVSASLSALMPKHAAQNVASILSFITVTLSFVLFADAIPKRVAMAFPETVALFVIKPMTKVIFLFSPLSRAFNALVNAIFRLCGMTEKRGNDITSAELNAAMEAGTMAGVLRVQEKELIDNVFELDSRTVSSAMTVRENIVFFDINESEEDVRNKIKEQAHSTYLVCDGDIDHVVGYVDSKELLERVLKGRSLSMQSGIETRPPLILPDALTLAEAMDQFKGRGEDLAVVLNEYALVVGIISLKDIMTMLMGSLIGEEEQILKRDEHSWLIEGATHIDDLKKAFGIEEFPSSEGYETVGGFLTYMLRRIPYRADSVDFGGYKFEVMDIDNYKIDQVLVTRLDSPAAN